MYIHIRTYTYVYEYKQKKVYSVPFLLLLSLLLLLLVQKDKVYIKQRRVKREIIREIITVYTYTLDTRVCVLNKDKIIIW